MEKQNPFLKRIEENRKNLTKKQSILAEYILKNYKTAAFLSSVPLGKKAGVSEATVIRFARALGYEGFIDMIKDIQDFVKNELTTIDKLENMGKLYENKTILDEIIQNNQMIIKALKENVNQQQITEIVSKMSKASKIVIVGFESSSGAAEYLGYNLVRVASRVEVINENHNNFVNIIKNCDKDTFVVLMAFPRYSRKIVELAEFFNKNKAYILSITDSIISPVSEYSDSILLVPKYDFLISNLDVSVGVITLLQTIILEYGRQNFDEAQENLGKLEDLNRSFGVFY